eukprot:Platyproteum_vivax@DN6818_c0_g1_i1.p1
MQVSGLTGTFYSWMDCEITPWGMTRWTQCLAKLLHLYTIGVLSVREFFIASEMMFDDDSDDLHTLRRIVKAREQVGRRNNSYFCSNLASLNHTGWERSGNSYLKLPEEFPKPLCHSNSDDPCLLELNKEWISVPKGSEDYSFKHMRRNQFEEMLFKAEDDRYELDMVLEANRGATEMIAPVSDALRSTSPHLRDKYKLDREMLKDHHVKAIGRIYGDHGIEIIELLCRNPQGSVPVILNRLIQKGHEWEMARRELHSSVWKENFKKNFSKSLDHRSFYFKTEERRYTNVKSFVREAHRFYERLRGLSSETTDVDEKGILSADKKPMWVESDNETEEDDADMDSLGGVNAKSGHLSPIAKTPTNRDMDETPTSHPKPSPYIDADFIEPEYTFHDMVDEDLTKDAIEILLASFLRQPYVSSANYMASFFRLTLGRYLLMSETFGPLELPVMRPRGLRTKGVDQEVQDPCPMRFIPVPEDMEDESTWNKDFWSADNLKMSVGKAITRKPHDKPRVGWRSYDFHPNKTRVMILDEILFAILRFFQKIYSRLRIARDLIMKPASPSRVNVPTAPPPPNSNPQSRWVDFKCLAKMFVIGEMDLSRFEDELRNYVGNSVYLFVTLDKVSLAACQLLHRCIAPNHPSQRIGALFRCFSHSVRSDSDVDAYETAVWSRLTSLSITLTNEPVLYFVCMTDQRTGTMELRTHHAQEWMLPKWRNFHKERLEDESRILPYRPDSLAYLSSHASNDIHLSNKDAGNVLDYLATFMLPLSDEVDYADDEYVLEWAKKHRLLRKHRGKPLPKKPVVYEYFLICRFQPRPPFRLNWVPNTTDVLIAHKRRTKPHNNLKQQRAMNKMATLLKIL